MTVSDGLSRVLQYQEVAEPNDVDLLPTFVIDQENVFFKRISEDVHIPSKGTDLFAGYDLSSLEDFTLNPTKRHMFKTGISIQIPEGWYGRIAPRSGLALKKGIDVLAGVIDSDYRGEIGIILYNSGDEPFNVKKGDSIAQLIFKKHLKANLIEFQNLTETK